MNCLLVGEIGINHNGSLDVAKKLIDVAADCGLDYVKFQKRTIDLVYSDEELNRNRESPWGTTNRDQKLGLEFSKLEYDEIDRYCKEKRIGWFGSPWDVKSVDFLMQYEPDYIKVAAACVTDRLLLQGIRRAINGTKTRIILSTGMSTIDEITESKYVLGAENIAYMLSCTSSYPTPDAEINLNRIKALKSLYGNTAKIGFSNHSAGIVACVAAMILGAEMLEFHVTLDRAMYGSDQSASIEPPGIAKISSYKQFLDVAMGDGVIGLQPSEVKIKEKLRKK